MKPDMNVLGKLLKIGKPIRRWTEIVNPPFKDGHIEYYYTADHAVTHLPALDGDASFAACGATDRNYLAYALVDVSDLVCLRCVRVYRAVFGREA